MTYRADDDAAFRRRDELVRLLGTAVDDCERQPLATEIAEIDRQRVELARVRLPMVARARIASPCTQAWDTMVGDGAVRGCTRCEKEVFDLSLMTLGQAEALIASRVGAETCARLFQRRDGTMMFADCEVGARGVVMRHVAAASTALTLGAASMAWANAAPPPEPMHIAPSQTSAAVYAAGEAFLYPPEPSVPSRMSCGTVRPHVGGPWSSTAGGMTSMPAPPRGRLIRVIAEIVPSPGGGTFDPLRVEQSVHARRNALLACYERELRSSPDLAGQLDVELTVLEAGYVTDVRAVENTVGSDDVEVCVIRVLRGFRFPEAPAGGHATVRVSFVFGPARPTD